MKLLMCIASDASGLLDVCSRLKRYMTGLAEASLFETPHTSLRLDSWLKNVAVCTFLDQSTTVHCPLPDLPLWGIHGTG